MKVKWLAYPYYIWMGIFIIIPLLLILYYGLTVSSDGVMQFSIDSIARVFEPVYIKVLWRSIEVAVMSTVVCFAMGYPVAYILSRGEFSKKSSLLFLFVIPMWMNFLLRTYAWLTILESNGLVNQFFELIGFNKIEFLYNQQAVILGMVYNFLPFMILPIHSVLVKMDRSIIEAAQDLGANSRTVFFKVIFPLSIPGIISGITMVFMPAVTTFVISDLLGGKKQMLIGNVIEQQFLSVRNWNFGSALSIFLMAVILVFMSITNVFDGENEGGTLM